jgi:hypothetical protein
MTRHRAAVAQQTKKYIELVRLVLPSYISY